MNLRFGLAVAAVLALAGCNARSPQPQAAAPAPAPPAVQLAEGGGCAAVIARYRAVAKSDADTGNANKSVYAQIDAEISRAEAACAAGRDGEARGLIAASKARHGYPGGG